MLSAGFTPGPWTVMEYPDGQSIEVEGGGCIMAAVHYDDGAWTAFEEAEANANLIAAAPDLYEALQTLVSMHIKRGPFDEPLGSSEQEDEINVACAALTKARGGRTMNLPQTPRLNKTAVVLSIPAILWLWVADLSPWVTLP